VARGLGNEAPDAIAIDLDSNATTRPRPEVIDAVARCMRRSYGNPSSAHGAGAAAAAALENARAQVQRSIGAAHASEIVFTSGGTESDAWALLGALEAQPGRDELVTTSVEHAAVLATCQRLQRRGVRVHLVPVDREGQPDREAFRKALSPRTALASVMWANNETGALLPVLELAALAHAAGALFHTDAVQAAGKAPLAVAGTAVDLLSLSAHKLHGPKGVGALYLRRGLRLPALLGGGKQERGMRAGTQNVPGAVGFGVAAELAQRDLVQALERMERLRTRLERGARERIDGCTVLCERGPRLCNTACLAFERCEGEALVHALDRAGIFVSSGAACGSGASGPSHVLRAMQVPPSLAWGAVRFSLSRDTTGQEIDRALDALAAAVALDRSRRGARTA
jgi:cysteine desulfurase